MNIKQIVFMKLVKKKKMKKYTVNKYHDDTLWISNKYLDMFVSQNWHKWISKLIRLNSNMYETIVQKIFVRLWRENMQGEKNLNFKF